MVRFCSIALLAVFWIFAVVVKADTDLHGSNTLSNGEQLLEATGDVQDNHRRFVRQATTKKVATTTKKATTIKATTKKATTVKGTTKKANLVNAVTTKKAAATTKKATATTKKAATTTKKTTKAPGTTKKGATTKKTATTLKTTAQTFFFDPSWARSAVRFDDYYESDDDPIPQSPEEEVEGDFEDQEYDWSIPELDTDSEDDDYNIPVTSMIVTRTTTTKRRAYGPHRQRRYFNVFAFNRRFWGQRRRWG